MSIKFSTVPTKSLSVSVSSSATTFSLNNILGWDGVALTSAAFGSTNCYGVFRNSTSTLIELFEFDPTTIASSQITILRRGLQFDGNLTTSVTANKLNWVRGDTLVDLGTDTPQLFEALKEYIDAASIVGAVPASATALGVTKLSATPGVTLGTATITIAAPAVVSFTSHGLSAGDVVNFTTSGTLPTGITAGVSYYVIATGLTANTFQISATLNGTAITTTGSQSGTHTLNQSSPVAVGTNDIRIPQNYYKVDTGAANAYVLTYSPAVTAYVAGQQFAFKAANTSTGASTLNVNGLGAKTITNANIIAGQIIEVVYDGTNFQVLSPSKTTGQTFNASGTYTKPGGLTKALVQAWGGGGSGGWVNGGATNSASGGGGGGYSERWLDASQIGSTETITIGAGGTAMSSNGAAVTGGNTTFGSLVTAYGGGAGYGNPGATTTSGGGGGGILGVGGGGSAAANSTAGDVLSGIGVANAAGASAINAGAGGGTQNAGGGFVGGNAIWGGAGGGSASSTGASAGGTSSRGGNGGAASNTAGNATDGVQPGGGGGGKYVGTSGNSGAGGAGRIIVTEFY